MAPTTVSLPAQARRGLNAVPYKRRALLYFTCGNPGLIGFYEGFLASLRTLLDEKPQTSETAYDIRGRNLFGFDDNEHEPFDQPGSKPWDLEGQVQAVYADVASQKWASEDGGNPRDYDLVILLGHSLGAYISVEIMSRHALRPLPGAEHLRIPHAMLLFPTLTHIAKSPQGRKATTLLRLLPSLATQGHLLAKTIISVLPPPALHFLLTRVMGLSPQTAKVAAPFLRSRDGLREFVYLGLSELEHIRDDAWGDEVWEVTKDENEENGRIGAGMKKPKVYIFFGRNDYWVANKWRDIFIESRKGGRTSIEVDVGDISHAFCLNDQTSFVVAEKVRGWIRDTETKQELELLN